MINMKKLSIWSDERNHKSTCSQLSSHLAKKITEQPPDIKWLRTCQYVTSMLGVLNEINIYIILYIYYICYIIYMYVCMYIYICLYIYANIFWLVWQIGLSPKEKTVGHISIQFNTYHRSSFIIFISSFVAKDSSTKPIHPMVWTPQLIPLFSCKTVLRHFKDVACLRANCAEVDAASALKILPAARNPS